MEKQTTPFSFELGDIVVHKTATRNNAVKLLVIGRGHIETNEAYENLYLVSFSSGGIFKEGQQFARTFIAEFELKKEES